jgi:hypothetical protein
MATAIDTKDAKQLPQWQSTPALLRRYATNRKVLVVGALLMVGGGLALNWSWLVAAGVAPIILALAPCAAMCALGVCMSRMGDKSCSGSKGDRAPGTGPGDPQGKDGQ